MNKTDLIETVAKDTGVSVKDTRLVINGFIETIKSKLLYGVDVKIKDFMNFELKVSNPKRKFNPITQEYFEVPKQYRVKASLSRLFTDKIKEKTVY